MGWSGVGEYGMYRMIPSRGFFVGYGHMAESMPRNIWDFVMGDLLRHDTM